MAPISAFDQNVEDFLDVCKKSGDQAYSKFKDLLEKLENPATRVDARRFLSSLEMTAKKGLEQGSMMEKYHFDIHQLALSNIQGSPPGLDMEEIVIDTAKQTRQTMTLLEMSSIFMPEDWSFTFYEGIMRHPDTGFYDRDITELGCGNGWISIALAERYCPRKVYGLDINPRAIKIAWINLYLNALNPDGTPVLDREGKTLLDRVEFHVSDLLAYIRNNDIILDRVIGCIPQVLSPDPEATLNLVSETMSEEFLHSLSNYCGMQGFVEDQFGLGLIARAVEEAIEVIKPQGAVILNMGGRPGQAVCERLFLRRGFHIQKLWQTRVNQAADTDILALVEIEKSSRHRFEFFMGPVSQEPISGRTAYAFAKAGGTISHGLSVYECRLNQPNHVKAIFKFLKQTGYEDTRSALDLSFGSPAVGDEKIAFLSHLAASLQHQTTFPYEASAGSDRFRHQIAAFLRLYFRIPLTAQNVVVVPSRGVAVEQLLRLYGPHLALIDASFSKWVPKKWLCSLPSEGVPVVVEAPRRTDLIVRLARALRPQLLVLSLADFEMRTETAFSELLAMSADIGARLFLDISDHLELSSLPATNGVLQFLAETPLPPHAAIICGLVKNQVYSDLEIGFLLAENADLLTAMAYGGEAAATRSASIPQLYYGCLLNELLSFQIPDRHTVAQRHPKAEADDTRAKFIGLTSCTANAFHHLSGVSDASKATDTAANGIETGSFSASTMESVLKMDFGENELPCPPAVKQLVFEGFGRQHMSEAEMDPKPEILQILASRFGINPQRVWDVVIGDGAGTLFSRLMAACSQEGGTAFFPMGSYGPYIAAAQFAGVATQSIPTLAENSFKLNSRELGAAIKGCEFPWLILTAPLVNPTGAIYTDGELQELLGTCRQLGVRVVLDTCFSGLHFSHEPIAVHLEDSLAVAGESRFSVATLGSISKQFSAGGLRFGYVALRDPFFLEAFRESTISRPHGTLRFAVKKILGLLNQDAGPMKEQLAAQRTALKDRAHRLAQVLSEAGWEPLLPQGGLSLLARPTKYEGKHVTLVSRAGTAQSVQGAGPSSKAFVLDQDSIVEALLYSTGLLIKGSSWTGIEGHCRFVFSVSEDKFLDALQRIQDFHKMVFTS